MTRAGALALAAGVVATGAGFLWLAARARGPLAGPGRRVVFWGQPGCPQCAAAQPVFRRVAAREKLPSAIMDAGRHWRVSDAVGVTETPTVMLLEGKRVVARIDDAKPTEAQIRRLFRR